MKFIPRSKIYALLFLSSAILAAPVKFCGQNQPLHYERLSVKNGLSSDRVTGIIQDRKGFYWISTTDGLNRFDGSRVKIFRHKSGDSTTIAHNNCFSLLEGNDGDIWMATEKGVSRYTAATGSFRNYFFHHPYLNDNIINSIKGLAKDAEGNIWASSYGLWCINPDTDSIYGNWYRPGDSASLSDPSSTHKLVFDYRNNGLWVNTDNALHFFDIASGQFFYLFHNPLQWRVFNLPDKNPFLAAANGIVWYYDKEESKLYRSATLGASDSFVHISFLDAVSDFSTDGGGNPFFSFEIRPAVIFDWQLKKGVLLPANNKGRDEHFSGVASGLFTDGKQNKWIWSSDGLHIIKHTASAAEVLTFDRDKEGDFFSIGSFVSSRDFLWLQGGKTLYRYNYIEKDLREIGISRGNVYEVLLNTGDSVLWIASRNEVVLINCSSNRVIRKTAVSYAYFAIYARRSIWIGTWEDGLYEMNEEGDIINHYDEQNGIANKYLVCGWYDGSNNLWLGLNGGKGFSRFDLDERKFENFLITSGSNEWMETNTINSIVGDSQNNLWLGTYGGGIYFFNRRLNQYRNFQQSEGLSGNYVNTLAFDKAGNLWISTMKAIDILDVKTNTFRHVTEPLEQHNNDHIRNLSVTKEGLLFYCGKNKIIVIDPLKYTASFPEATILKSAFRIYDEDKPGLADRDEIVLNYRENFFTIEFSVLKVSPEIPAQYRYKLVGFDKEWNNAGNNGLANFTNVPPGKYSLLLNATNEAGEWNDQPLSMTITIIPPFWKTWWFYCITALSAASMVIYVVRNQVSRFKKYQQEKLRLIVATQEKEKRIIAAELHDDLGVRLSALKYFVTSLKKYLSPEQEQVQQTYEKTIRTIDEAVEDILYLLINLSPKTLNEYGYLTAVEDLVNKLAQLHIIQIKLHQAGMEGRLPAEIESGLYRITQELINNTLKHAGADSVELSIEMKDHHIELNYADNGKGFDPFMDKRGYGIDNIHTRVALLNGKIEWSSRSQKSNRVNIVIPYIHPLG